MNTPDNSYPLVLRSNGGEHTLYFDTVRERTVYIQKLDGREWDSIEWTAPVPKVQS